MSEFFLMSENGDAVGLALRLKEEGHNVSMYIRDDEALKRGQGLIELCETKPVTEYNGTIVISDCTGSGVFCDSLREAGVSVLGGSIVADKLEMEREYAAQVMADCGIATPKTEYFNDWEKAKAFVQEKEEKLVFKPEGDLSGVVPSYVSADQEDMLEMLDVFAGTSP